MKEKKFDYRQYLAEGWLYQEAKQESYPQATAWLQEHPDVEVYGSLADVLDDPDSSDDIVTDLMEAGYMFISELEAALRGKKYGPVDDDSILASCENGVIDDPAYNPSVNSFDY